MRKKLFKIRLQTGPLILCPPWSTLEIEMFGDSEEQIRKWYDDSAIRIGTRTQIITVEEIGIVDISYK